MKAKPLAEDTSSTKTAPEDIRVVKLVSNDPSNQIEGLDDFLRVFNTGENKAEILPFRYTIQRKAKRSIGGKFGQGLSTEVTESVDIKLNEDLFGLRRWMGAIRQDPSSVMLLNIHKVKEDALASPLAFSDLLKTGRPILVTGADHTARAQLLATIDPEFEKMPKEVENDHNLKLSLVSRVQRPKGFLQTIRNLLEFDYLPQKIKDRINEINTGGDPSKLSEAEIVNLCLLADIASRYRAVLDNFKNVLENSNLQMAQVMNMFELLMADVPLKQVIIGFKEFLDTEEVDFAKVKNKSQLFGHIYKYFSTDDGSSRQGRMDRLSRFNKTLQNQVIKHRTRIDPFLWRHCHFLSNAEPIEKKMIEGLKPLFRVTQQFLKTGEKEAPENLRKQFALQVYELAQHANANTANFRIQEDYTRHSAANRLLSLVHLENGRAFDMNKYLENGQLVPSADAFMKRFLTLPLPPEDLKKVLTNLRPVLFLNEVVSAELQKSTLDVMHNANKAREKTLRDIYVLNSLEELVTYSFHMGDNQIGGIDRVSAINLGQGRLGFEISGTPQNDYSIGLFTRKDEKPLGQLTNEPNLLRLAYTELIGLRVEKLVKRMVDRKINYFQQTYGKNFFEVIYNGVVTSNNLPLSRNQFANFIKKRNILGSLDAKGWKPTNENEMQDPFFIFVDNPAQIYKMKQESGPLQNFEPHLAKISATFRQFLNDLKKGAEENPNEGNPKYLLWNLCKQGIYNLSRPEAKGLFRKSVYFRYLQDLIAKISSENYSTFASNIVDDGIKIYVPWKYNYLQLIGTRFGFIIDNKVVKYQLLSAPTDNPKELDPVSKTMYEQMEALLNAENVSAETRMILDIGDLINKMNSYWQEYSRCITIAMVDRVLSETVVKDLEPGRILAKNLWFLPDQLKLGLGRSVVSSEAIPFAKVLQAPEIMGNIVKNPRSSNTTIDDFSIQVHKISNLRNDFDTTLSLAEDTLDILQSISHDKVDAPGIAKYEQALQHVVKIFSKPLRAFKEKDVQDLHTVAVQIKEILQTFQNSPSAQKNKVTTRIQAHLQSRRSDGHSIKLNFTDEFIIDKTEIKVMQKVKRGDEVIGKRQKKIEVELEATHLTMPLKIREVVRTQDILANKRYVVFSPEGHKKKQVDYAMDIIDILQMLRGNAITFYVDTSALSEEQVHHMATRIKPHNFFNMDTEKNEAPAGLKTKVVQDPLSGRAITIVEKNEDVETEAPVQAGGEPQAAEPAQPVQPS